MPSFSIISLVFYIGGVVLLFSAMFAQNGLQDGTALTPKLIWNTPPPKMMWEIFTYLTASLAALSLVVGLFYGWWQPLLGLVAYHVFEPILHHKLIPHWAKAHGEPYWKTSLPAIAIFGPGLGSGLIILSVIF